MKNKILLIKISLRSLVVLCALTVLPVAVHAVDIPVTACGTLSSAGARYVLQNDISSTGTCITITGNDITFDLNGHTITYDTLANTGLPNQNFEAGNGDVPSNWDLSQASTAIRRSNKENPMEGEWHLYLGNAPDGSAIISPWTYLPPNTKSITYALRGDKTWAYETKPVFQMTVEYQDGTEVCNVSSEEDLKCEFTTGATTGNYRAILKLTAGNGLTLLNYGEYPSIDQFDLRTVGHYGISASYKKNIVIQNGTVIQGEAKSYKGHSIFFYGGDNLLLSNMTINTYGVEASSVETNYSPNITIDSCTMINRNPIKFNRHQLSAAVSIFNSNNVVITKNSIDSGSGWGCIFSPNSNQTISFNNLKTNNSTTNHMAIYVFNDNPITNINIHDNTIEASGGSANGGIGIGGAPDGSEIYNNNIVITKANVNIEYEGAFGGFGIMLKDYKNETCKNVTVHDNTILMLGTYDDYWDGTSYAGGEMAGIMNMCSGGNVEFSNNTITGQTIKQNVLISAIQPGGQTSHEVKFIKNTVTCDSRIINLGGYAGQGDIIGNVKFISNTFKKGNNPLDFHTFEGARLTNITTDQFHFIDTKTLNGAAMDDMAPGWYNFKFSVDWYLNIVVKDSSGNPVANTTASIVDKDGNPIFTADTDSAGKIKSIVLAEFTLAGTGDTASPNYITPHTISLTLPGDATVSKQLYMDNSKELIYQIGVGFTVTDLKQPNVLPAPQSLKINIK